MPPHQFARFGESRLRMLRVVRRGDRHDPQDLTVTVRCEGEQSLPGEPLRNLVHRVAAQRGHEEIEALALTTAARIAQEYPTVGRVRVEVGEEQWRRLEPGGKAQGQAFTPAGGERRVAVVTTNGAQTSITAGIDGLVLMRSAGLLSAGPHAGGGDAEDGAAPIFIGALSARWQYTSGEIAFGPYRHGIRASIVETFAWHARRSAQETLTSMADVILASYDEVASVTVSLEERPYRPADLLELAIARDALFVVRDEPLAIVEVTVDRA